MAEQLSGSWDENRDPGIGSTELLKEDKPQETHTNTYN